MNRFLLIQILLLFLTTACAQEYNYQNLSSEDFNEVIKSSKGTLLDVRTSTEFANGHIKNAGQLNYYVFDFRQKILLLPKGQPVYLYCNTGWRSKRAAEILVENGYIQVYNLEKGIMDWNLNNLPVIIEPNAQPEVENKMEPNEFYALIKSNEPVFIDFYAPWCAPCRKMMPMMDSLMAEYNGRVTIVKINVDASKKLVKELQIGSVPYLVLYKSEHKTFEHDGIIDKKSLETLFEEISNSK